MYSQWMSSGGASTPIQHWGTAVQIWGCRHGNVRSVYTSSSPAPPVHTWCSPPSSGSQWGCVGSTSPASRAMEGTAPRTLPKASLSLEWAQKGNKQVLGQPLGRVHEHNPRHNYCRAMIALGRLTTLSPPWGGTAQSHKHVKGWIFKWNSAELAAAELCTSQQPLCAA